jgi:hypothetical protein
MLDTLKSVLDAQNYLYEICGLKVENFIAENESAEYYAHSYSLVSKNVRFRIAKRTPTKTGFFVTIWKRNSSKIIVPYDDYDDVDLFVINVVDRSKTGQFVFPKSILIEKNIISNEGKDGKRAIRVYSPWDKAENTQASRSKKWQCEYFADISSGNSDAIKRAKYLYFH